MTYLILPFAGCFLGGLAIGFLAGAVYGSNQTIAEVKRQMARLDKKP